MKGMTWLRLRCRCIVAILFCAGLTAAIAAWGQSPSGFSQIHFDGTFVILGQHILDTSDLRTLLQETNSNFRDLSKSDAKDVSWDSDGVRYTADLQNLKLTWVIDPNFLRNMGRHPTHIFNVKLSIFEVDIVRNRPIPEALLSEYGFAKASDQVLIKYMLNKNGWKIKVITDQDRKPEAVTLEHSLAPD